VLLQPTIPPSSPAHAIAPKHSHHPTTAAERKH
jgi:hypothetical protein